MNNSPKPRSTKHRRALEAYRVAQAQLNRYESDHRAFGGDRTALVDRPEYVALVDARDAAKAAVPLADPKVPTPKKVKK